MTDFQCLNYRKKNSSPFMKNLSASFIYAKLKINTLVIAKKIEAMNMSLFIILKIHSL